MRAGRIGRSVWVIVIAIAVLAFALLARAAWAQQNEPSPAALQSAQASLDYLRQVMDQYHRTYPVYADISSPANSFHARAKMPDENAPIFMNGSFTDNPHSGATCIQNIFMPGGNLAAVGGYYFMNGTLSGTDTHPALNFGTVPNAGVNLTGATALTFWVRGKHGGEHIEFFVGGVGRVAETGVPTSPYPDSSPRRPDVGARFTLTTTWQQITIDLSGMNLSYVLGAFGWYADAVHNPGGAEFYLDDIEFQLGPAGQSQRLNEPRFLRSFTTLPLEPDPFDGVQDGDMDFVLRNLAATYDNALALLAFLADGSADSVRRAKLIGDAFVYAMQHDRTFNDNRACNEAIDPTSVNGARIRSNYVAGDAVLWPGWTPNGRVGTVAIPGFYWEANDTFYEVEQEATDTGNNAWAGIALSALYQRTGQASYLEYACKLGNFVHAQRNDSGTYQGFTGGIDHPEPPPGVSTARRMWASSEHNLDAHALFTTLYNLTGDARWQQDAVHARQLVEQMWDVGSSCYLAGTTDQNTRNTSANTIPVDVQGWSNLSLLAQQLHPQALDCAESRHLNTSDGFTGVDFNNDKDGVWFEGTAQIAVAEERAGRSATAEFLRSQLRLAQRTAPFGDNFGIVAASHDGLSTGFLTARGDVFKYFRRLHVAVAAWNVFAQLDANPYYARFLRASTPGFDVNRDNTPDIMLQDTTSTTVGAWTMDGNGHASTFTFVYTAPIGGWRIVTTLDINGDGVNDILMQDSASTYVGAWILDASGHVASFLPLSSANVGNWRVVGALDVNGDGIEDILVQDVASTYVAAWLLNSVGQVTASLPLYSANIGGWHVVATADINGDGVRDIILQDSGTTQVGAWIMDGNSHVASFQLIYTSNIGTWKVVGAADLNHDGRADLILQDSATTQVGAWIMNIAGQPASFIFISQANIGTWKVNGRN